MIPVLTGRASSRYRVVAADLPSLIVADSPAFYWKMDETSGTTLAATVGGVDITLGTSIAKPTLGVAGQVGNAIRFDGVNDFASAAIDLSAYSTVAFEFLLNWDGYANDDDFALSFRTAAGLESYVDPNGGAPLSGLVGLLSNPSSGHFSYRGYARPTAAAWHHWVVRMDIGSNPNTLGLVVDGVPLSPTGSTRTETTSATFGAGTLHLFSRANSSLFGAGRMQHLAIHQTLSDARALAHARAAGF